MASYVITGNGPAGTQAALAAKKQDPAAAVTIVSREAQLFYYRYYLPHLLAGAKDAAKMVVHPESFYAKKGVDLILGQEVISLNPEKNLLTLESGDSLPYSALVIATGSRARGPIWPGSSLEGVVTLREWADVPRILERVHDSGQAVVVGGGLLGIELAWAFRELGMEVNYLIKEDRFWPQMLDAEASAIVERRVRAAGVDLIVNASIKEIAGDDGRVSGVTTESGRRIPCQLLGVAIGAVPETGLLRDSGVLVDRGVIVDDHLRSNYPNVYAAGDVAQAYDVVYGEHRVNTSWLNAYRQGDIAGTNMAGGEKVFAGGIPYNLMEIYGIGFVSMGLPNAAGAGYQVISRTEPELDLYQKVVLREGVVVGATLLGQVERARYFEEMIKRRLPVGDVAESLLDPEFDLDAIVK